MGKIFKDCKQCGTRYLTCHCEVVSKDDLRKLVVEARRMKAACSWGAVARVHGQYVDKIEKLLKRGE